MFTCPAVSIKHGFLSSTNPVSFKVLMSSSTVISKSWKELGDIDFSLMLDQSSVYFFFFLHIGKLGFCMCFN